MPLRFMAALLGLALLALPFTLPARAETTDQLLGETFYDCYASIDANYFTNRDMKRGAMLYQAIEAMWARGADRLRKDPATVERLSKLAVVPVGNTPAEFDAFVRAEYAKYKDIVRISGAKVD